MTEVTEGAGMAARGGDLAGTALASGDAEASDGRGAAKETCGAAAGNMASGLTRNPREKSEQNREESKRHLSFAGGNE